MAKCSSCQAPLNDGSLVCSYCGSRNDLDLAGIHFNTTHASDTPRICPRCTEKMATIDIQLNGRFLIERCDSCCGLFFDPGELETLLEAAVSNVFQIDRQGLDAISRRQTGAVQPISYLKCPVCSQIMNRVNFGAKSGVIVDRCGKHGIWLDGGELRQLMEWMKMGGKLLDRQREEERKQEQDREERQRRRDAAGALEPTPFDQYSEPLRQSDPDLLDIVVKAIRILTR